MRAVRSELSADPSPSHRYATGPSLSRFVGEGLTRRAAIAALGGMAVSWPVAGRAQQGIPLVGFLRPGSRAETGAYTAAFREGLKEAGYVEGKTVRIEYRFAEGQIDRLRPLALDLVNHGVKVIAAGGPPSVLAAKAASSMIPIVAAGFDDETLELVGNLGHPTGNITGFITLQNAAMYGKRLDLLHELLPTGATVAVLTARDRIAGGAHVEELAEPARALGMTLFPVTAGSDAEIEAAFAAATARHADALLVSATPFFTVRHDKIAELATRHRLPAIYPWREYAAAGGLISYASSLTAVWRGAGVYVGKILSGAAVRELPVQQPTTFELVINLNAAKAIGLAIPPSLFARADEVIE